MLITFQGQRFIKWTMPEDLAWSLNNDPLLPHQRWVEYSFFVFFVFFLFFF